MLLVPREQSNKEPQSLPSMNLIGSDHRLCAPKKMDMSTNVKVCARICRRLQRQELRTGQTQWKLREPSVRKIASDDSKLRR